MKKMLLLLAGALGAALAKKRMDAGRPQGSLWTEATDPVTRT